MSGNFYTPIAHTLRTQPSETLLTWPAEPAPAARYSGAEIAAAVAAMRQRLAWLDRE